MRVICRHHAANKILFVFIIFFIISFILASNTFALVVEPDYFDSALKTPLKLSGAGKIKIKPTAEMLSGKGKTRMLTSAESFGYGNSVAYLDSEASITFDIYSPVAGGYYIEMDYYIPEASMQELSISVKINGEYQFYESRNIKLRAAWKDSTKQYEKDKFGNDIYPKPERVYRWQKDVLNHGVYRLSKPLIFNLMQGKNTVTIANNNVKVAIGAITFIGSSDIPSYYEYMKTSNAQPAEDFISIIQAEDYVEKSASFIRGNKNTNYNMYPYDPKRKLINMLDANAWEKPGESVTYEFEVPEDGLYNLAFKYIQDEKKDLPVFKRISIDGRVIFEELNEYAFPYTGSSPENEVIKVDGKPAMIFLSKGLHKLTIESTASPFFETYESLNAIIADIYDIAFRIKMISGNRIDKNRDWEIVEYIPDLPKRLSDSADILMREYKRLKNYSKRNTDLIADLMVAAMELGEFAKDPDSLVNNLDQFSVGVGSISQRIATILPELLDQPMGIDCIYVYGNKAVLPSPSVAIFKAIAEEIKKFFISFFASNERNETTEKGKLNIWAQRPLPYIEIIRELVEGGFTKGTGIEVNISSMPDEQKLLLAVSAGRAPDIVMGATSYRPFDFALRGALQDLRQFNDFGKIIKFFHPETFVPFTIDDSCYALPETLNFNVLYYRKDILEKLNLEVPQTWDDVIKILPVLSRYGMDFNTLLANVGGFKHFGTTVPFIQQFNGKIYSEDGTKVELGDPRTIEAFKLMTNLYTRYSLPESVPNFYSNFRFGVTPIGMSDFNTYILLKNAAPEIMEQWDIAPGIGVKNEKNEILRYQPSVDSSCIMLKHAKMPHEAWEFMKWWMSTDVQVTFVRDLQLRFGPEYLYNSANLEAFKLSNAYNEDDLEVILMQFEHIKEIPRHPAYFSVERELSSAWNKVVFSGVPPRTALDQAIIMSNREITRKLKEFGYMDEQGVLIKPFRIATRETIESWKE